MISCEEAQARILENAHRLGIEHLPLGELLGTVMAEPAVAPFDLPRFNNSAMDGYGVRQADIAAASAEQPVALAVQTIIQAGDNIENFSLQPGHAVRIFTGAPIPAGVEAVIMQEQCRVEEDRVWLSEPAEPEENIRKRGEEFTTGTEILTAGTVINPPVIGLLATLGYAFFPVYVRPRVAIIATGNELTPPGEPLAPGRIYDSNSYALAAALQAMGLPEATILRAPDDPTQTRTAFQEALANHDVVITLGGVSVGDFDYVKDVVEQSGIRTVFWRIAIKPGKPVYFGVDPVSNHKLVFGLPGNPVSALVTFHQLVQPALRQMMGLPPEDAGTGTLHEAILMQNLKKKPGRLEWVRGQLHRKNGTWQVHPTDGQDSHMLGGLAQADCLIVFPEAADRLTAGQPVTVTPLVW